MKKTVFYLYFTIFVSFLTSCNFWREADFVIRRNRTHLDLEKPENELVRLDQEVNFQNKWYIFKNDGDIDFSEGDTVTFSLKGTPEQDIPGISAYLVEYKDPQFSSKSEKIKLSKDPEYKKQQSEYIPVSDEQLLFESAAADVKFNVKKTFTFSQNLVDNTQIFWLLYVNESALPENYFNYYDNELEEAKKLAQEDAKLKAERRNKKEKLSEDDENYHKPEDFEENCYKERVKNLGAKRIIINDVELKIEIMNK
ncbi:MAG: hypothetical protein SOZ96_06495 [Treponema sp.]|nr:hypothetical protein [Treponema sp.]MDY5124447.1 hypothetical protein [Treponema sp.]